jgi:chromosome segregation ATPase
MTADERETQINQQDKEIILLQRSLETSKIHTQKMHETCASLKSTLNQTRSELGAKCEEMSQLEHAYKLLNEQFIDTQADLEQYRHAITLNQSDLEHCQNELDKCQTELLDTRELLSMRETELELSRQEFSECQTQLAQNAAEIALKDAEIQSKAQEIFDFQAQKYPERCTSLQEQLLTMTRHAQTYEQRIDGMEKERRSLRLALLNEIEYLRSA